MSGDRVEVRGNQVAGYLVRERSERDLPERVTRLIIVNRRPWKPKKPEDSTNTFKHRDRYNMEALSHLYYSRSFTWGKLSVIIISFRGLTSEASHRS